jgi:O-antigen/teichoic acid export membrane protein
VVQDFDFQRDAALSTGGESVMDTLPSSEASPAMQARASNRDILLAAKGGGIIFVGTVFAYGIRMLIGVLMGRFLGAEQYGLYNLALTAGSIAAGLALLGLPSTLVRYISLFRSRRDTVGLWGALQLGLGLATVAGLLMGVGLYALAIPIAERLFHEPRLVPLLRLASLIVPSLALTHVLAAATRGFKKMQYDVIAEKIFQPLTRLILILVLAFVGLTAAKAVTIYILGLIVTCGILLYFLNRLFSLRRPLKAARRDTKEMLSFGLPIYFSSLINTFDSNVQTVLLGTLNTVTDVGIFAVANQVSMVARMFNQSVGIVSQPIVSELYDRGEREQMARFYQTMTKWTFTLNIPLFLIVLLFPRQILSVFGGDFVEGTVALVILAWANLVKAAGGIWGGVLDMTGKTFLRLVNSILLSVVTLGLNFLLIPRWGVVGAATAALVSTIVVNLVGVLEGFILLRMLPYNVDFVKPVAAGLVTLAVAWMMRQWLNVEAHLVYTAMSAIVILAVYVGMTLLLGLSPEDRVVLTHLRRRMGAVLPRS